MLYRGVNYAIKLRYGAGWEWQVFPRPNTTESIVTGGYAVVHDSGEDDVWRAIAEASAHKAIDLLIEQGLVAPLT